MEIKDLYKYPRTYHFPFSEGATSDDKILNDIHIFDNSTVADVGKESGQRFFPQRKVFTASFLQS